MAEEANSSTETRQNEVTRAADAQQTGNSVAKTAAIPFTARGPPLHQMYALPAPIRTFPLPSFYPSNPLSLFHVIYEWVKQVAAPPPAEPSVVHQGFWSRATRSVQVTDPKSIRALWEQGFFGKGNFSRSEPHWLKREKSRRGSHHGHVAENFTSQRREDRRMMKWDRARKEQEAIEKTRLEEAWIAPVGPLELLALPNSAVVFTRHQNDMSESETLDDQEYDTLAKRESMNGHISTQAAVNGGGIGRRPNGILLPKNSMSNGNVLSETVPTGAIRPATDQARPHTPTRSSSVSLNHSFDTTTETVKRRKSVRFSPKVESTTFLLSDPPSPAHSPVSNGKLPLELSLPNGSSPLTKSPEVLPADPVLEEQEVPSEPIESEPEIIDREHLQLTVEEAFYLVFALGALRVTDQANGQPMETEDMFATFCQTSGFPPSPTDLQPDNPFLIQYAVYHHFRSLGWVPRSGVKFGVDWLLYNRGPVFSHAEFAIVVQPAYSDPWGKAQGRTAQQKSWHWLHMVNRVQSTALKTMVIVYVDIPPPCVGVNDPATMLKRYKVREFMVKRWLYNRNRD
ncbi:hypothetical protein F4778DRAFT_711763 [Xylariomycetidae sp. FL2044]|nr:hypothetical protein F4778DRAFT_711763 [Xylariomycetidae sp. FL2044]